MNFLKPSVLRHKSLLSIVLFSILSSWSIAADRAAEVHVTQKSQEGQVTCLYSLLNTGTQPIVSFAVGGNQELAGPYELSAVPVGFDSGLQGEKQGDGWQASLLTESGNPAFAVEWETKDYADGVMPQKSKQFELRFLSPRFDCEAGHWTAISRDSQIISGLLKEFAGATIR